MKTQRLRAVGLLKVEYAALILSILAFILASAKWLIPAMAWAAPGLLIFFFRRMGLGKAILFGFVARLVANLIGGYEVVPFPTPVFVVTMSIAALVGIIPYLFDRWVNSRIPGFISTLAFPAMAVSIEYLDSLGPGGTWGSIAHTQYQFQSLIQIASVVGIWGISFLIYWLASVINWAYENRENKSSLRFGSAVIGGVFVLVLLFGQFRLSPLNVNESSMVRVAGVTASTVQLLETIYQDNFGERLKINPKISQSSPELQEINKALVPFIKGPNEPRFKNSRLEMARIHDELFTLSQEEADAGAKIILWSEGNALAFKEDEGVLIAKGREFAQKNDLYLLLATVVITPGEIIPGEKFQEAFLIGGGARHEGAAPRQQRPAFPAAGAEMG